MPKGVQKIYSEVATTYELVNHILTFGLDWRLRRKAAKEALKVSGDYWLDICSGTGEMARDLSRLANDKTNIVSVDFSLPMLSRAREKKHVSHVFFSLADAGLLPFSDKTFDLLTISFATRNLNPRKDILITYLKEFYRVLKPGGLFVNLETSQPRFNILKKVFHLYIKLSVQPVGYFLSGSKAGYSYLSYTIPRFYDAEAFSSILRETGFKQVDFHRLLFGIAAIHTALK